MPRFKDLESIYMDCVRFLYASCLPEVPFLISCSLPEVSFLIREKERSEVGRRPRSGAAHGSRCWVHRLHQGEDIRIIGKKKRA